MPDAPASHAFSTAAADVQSLTGRSSRDLLRLARKGDRSALNVLFARHLPRLHRWASGRLPRWARDGGDTTDLVQETALNVFKRLDSFTPDHRGALQAYLRQAVVNRLRDEYRRIARAPVRAELSDEHPDGQHPSPLDEAIGEETAERYRKALARLRLDEQQAIVSRVEMGYSYAQIALVLEKPSPDAARMCVSRALVRLAEEMDRATPA